MLVNYAKITWDILYVFLLFSLVFSQSLISLDLIEDFLELVNRQREEGKSEIYKGKCRNARIWIPGTHMADSLNPTSPNFPKQCWSNVTVNFWEDGNAHCSPGNHRVSQRVVEQLDSSAAARGGGGGCDASCCPASQGSWQQLKY